MNDDLSVGQFIALIIPLALVTFDVNSNFCVEARIQKCI